MSLEHYIEKDIVRKIKLCEYIFEHKKLIIRELSKKLDVTFNTIKKDLSMISVQLSEFLSHYEMTATEVSMLFTKETTRYDLIKKIYSESKFLKVAARYLLGDTNYLSIVDEEFVSVTKAFKIKKDVEQYLIEENILDNDNKLKNNELLYRMIFVSIWMHTDFLDSFTDNKCLKIANLFVEAIFTSFSVNYSPNDREYLFLLYHTYLALTRSDKNLTFENHKSSRMNSSYNKLIEISHNILKDIVLSNKNIELLAIFCKLLIIKSKNYSIVNMNYQLDRQEIIENRPDVQCLIKSIEKEFNISLKNNPIFEIPFIYFIYSLWENVQNYFMERNYFLTLEQLDIADKIDHILINWKDTCHPKSNLKFSKTCVLRLISEIHSSLISNNIQKQLCMIVAENELSHIIYRESLQKWMNSDSIMIDDTLYYSIDEIPLYKDDWPHFIIYERSLLTKEENRLPDNNLFYISRKSLLEDIKIVRDNLYEKFIADRDGKIKKTKCNN